MTDAQPYLISGPDAAGGALHILSPADRAFQEEWLQELLYRHPSILPVSFIDEAFAPAISIGREIAGIDNLFVSSRGLITIVETKLWRNPEAHRTVVAQILEYAHTLARWHYRELDDAVGAFMQRRHGETKSIYRIVKDSVPGLSLSDVEFQETVENCLNSARFALLMVGDRIYPGATQLAETIQSAPHLQYSIGFIELRCFKMARDSDWPLVVVPQIVARTREIERAVVKVIYEEKKPEIQITAPTETKVSGGLISQPEFIAKLPSNVAEVFKIHLEQWSQAGYTVYWGQVGFSLRLHWKGRLTTIFDAYPTYASILQEKWVTQYDLPSDAYRQYRTGLMRSPVISSSFASGKRYVRYEKLSDDDLALLLGKTDELARAMNDHTL